MKIAELKEHAKEARKELQEIINGRLDSPEAERVEEFMNSLLDPESKIALDDIAYLRERSQEFIALLNSRATLKMYEQLVKFIENNPEKAEQIEDDLYNLYRQSLQAVRDNLDDFQGCFATVYAVSSCKYNIDQILSENGA